MNRRAQIVLSAATVAAAVVLSAAQASAADPVLSLTAHALNLDAPSRARTTTLQISIDRWSTDEERKSLLDTIVEKDPDALSGALQKMPAVGRIRTTTSLGWDLHYARMEETASGGQRIIFATDRPMSFREAANAGRSTDYDVMVCEIRLGPDGKGEGRLVSAAKVTWDRATRAIEIENYGTQPVRLTSVTADKK
jgi:hypothetical protein